MTSPSYKTAAIAVASLLLAAGCEAAQHPTTASDSSSSAQHATPLAIPGEVSTPGYSLQGLPLTGSCGNLQGAIDAGSFVQAPCGTQAAYRVVDEFHGTDRSACKDADQYYITDEIPQRIVCLDYDWTTDHCLSVRAGVAITIPCSTPGAKF